MEPTDYLVDFAGMDGTSPAENVRVKEVIRGEHCLRLVEFGSVVNWNEFRSTEGAER